MKQFKIPLMSENKMYVETKVTELEGRGYKKEADIKENKKSSTHVNDGKTVFFVNMIKA